MFNEKNTQEMHTEMSEIAITNDNNNFAPSLFLSVCEIICFGAFIFFLWSCIPLEMHYHKIFGSKTITSDFTQ